ncbi:ExbD/TolR family protein [Phaeobacter marinintestinus]|uniref:ExbD/TolR family protein n=1 Tax=Falsiphaeobacter marinintestinus TaxID=1492905 RepID=UPI0011B7C52A|nr:biopolymer transporter ExbD [Phaeobacter marinintestinus]
MDFSEPPRRRRQESIVPMINVVFLLLIFFLMTSHLATPDPFDVTLPDAVSEKQPESELILYVDKTGLLSFDDHEGQAAVAALTARSDAHSIIQMRADGALDSGVAARLLSDLAEAGLSRVELVVSPK